MCSFNHAAAAAAAAAATAAAAAAGTQVSLMHVHHFLSSRQDVIVKNNTSFPCG